MYFPHFDSSILCFCFYSYFFSCKEQLSLKPKTGMDPGPRNTNNKFIENGRKCWSESRIKILVYSIKRKELHAHRYKKYPRTCPSTGTKSNEFFFFTVVFLHPFALFFSFFSFFFFLFRPPFFLSSFALYTMIFTQFPPSTCGSGVGSPFSLFSLPLLEPSILNCEAACSLFRHHLHINAARELVGQHLMRG